MCASTVNGKMCAAFLVSKEDDNREEP